MGRLVVVICGEIDSVLVSLWMLVMLEFLVGCGCLDCVEWNF